MSGKTIAFASAVQAGANVPAQDATTNLGERDVVGNKADTEVATGTAANSTLSLMAYLKAMWDLLRSITFANLDAAISSRAAAATALSTAQWTNARATNLDTLSTALSTAQWTNARAANLDTLSTALSTATWTNARAANLDGVALSAAALFSTGLTLLTATNGSKSAWTQLIASTGGSACKKLLIAIIPAGATQYLVDIGIGGAGSESIIVPDLPCITANIVHIFEISLFQIPASTRVAVRAQDAGGNTLKVAVQGY
jgi:hypothetical protein